MSTAITVQSAGIPTSVKCFTWALIFAGLFFAYVFMYNPSLSFPGAAITDYSSQLGFYSTGVRVLGSVAALIISVVLNRPQLLAITLASRLVIELGDIVVGVATAGPMINNIMVGLLALLELWAILRCIKASRFRPS